MDPKKRLDLVLFGATGFTGRLVAEYLARHHGGAFRWAIAGRNSDKLEAVKRELVKIDPRLAPLEILLADSSDDAALESLAHQTRVVCTTVGPYAKYGLPLVSACANAGTSYCDLTGETTFVRQSIDRNHDKARANAARIVHCAGFDSIPSDLGVWILNEHFRRLGESMVSAAMFCGPTKGGFSGGTVASVMELLDAVSRDREARRLVADPYALNPDRSRDRGSDGPDLRSVRFDARIKSWTGPFLMAAINTRVVRRTNALLDYPYGKAFRYSEVARFGKGAAGFGRAVATTAAMGALMGAASVRPGRRLLDRMLPSAGEGPSQAERDHGFFKIRIVGMSETGRRVDAFVEGTSDPGYGETAKMLGETAACLALDAERLPERYGVLTPAAAFGDRLVERLRNAGMTFDTR